MFARSSSYVTVRLHRDAVSVHVDELQTKFSGLLTRKSTQKDVETDSSLTAMRLLFDKAERGGKDVLQLTHLLTSMAAAGVDPSDPYGRYQPVSALLIRQAMNSYVPHWMKVRLLQLLHACMQIRRAPAPRIMIPAVLLYVSQMCAAQLCPELELLAFSYQIHMQRARFTPSGMCGEKCQWHHLLMRCFTHGTLAEALENVCGLSG